MTKPQNKSITKFENNWLSKTLESLEKSYWGEPNYESHLVITCHSLRKKQLKDFETEDLRIMIGQNIGLKYLIPVALEVLSQNILAEGNYYEGDLLNNVLTSEKDYWKGELENWTKMCEIFKKNIETLKNFDTTREIKKSWFKAFAEFEKIN